MRYERQEVLVNRDCPAVTVPYGSPVTIEEGCFAQITQQLGGSYTVLVEGNLYRVEGVDADALGLEPIEPDQVHDHEGPITAESVERSAWALLATCYDPEIAIDIVNMGMENSRKVPGGGENIYATGGE